MVEFIEDITKTKFNEEKLKEIIKIENDLQMCMALPFLMQCMQSILLKSQPEPVLR
jgi:hypothetical protein